MTNIDGFFWPELNVMRQLWQLFFVKRLSISATDFSVKKLSVKVCFCWTFQTIVGLTVPSCRTYQEKSPTNDRYDGICKHGEFAGVGRLMVSLKWGTFSASRGYRYGTGQMMEEWGRLGRLVSSVNDSFRLKYLAVEWYNPLVSTSYYIYLTNLKHIY